MIRITSGDRARYGYRRSHLRRQAGTHGGRSCAGSAETMLRPASLSWAQTDDARIHWPYPVGRQPRSFKAAPAGSPPLIQPESHGTAA